MARAECETCRRLDAAVVARQVVGRQQPAALLDAARDALADVALVEAVAGRVDRRPAARPRVAPLLVGERAQGAGELGLAEHAAHRRNRPARSLEVDAGTARIPPDVVQFARQEAGQEVVPGKAIFGQRDGGRQDIGERQRTELGQGDRQGVDDRGDRSGQRPGGRDFSQATEVIGRGGRRRQPLTIDHDHFSPVGEVQDDRHLATQTEVGDLGHRGGKHGRHPGVDRVAAADEHPQARVGREVAPGRDNAHATHDLGPVGTRWLELLPVDAGAECEGNRNGQDDRDDSPPRCAEAESHRGESVRGYWASCFPNCSVPVKERIQTPLICVHVAWLMSLKTSG